MADDQGRAAPNQSLLFARQRLGLLINFPARQLPSQSVPIASAFSVHGKHRMWRRAFPADVGGQIRYQYNGLRSMGAIALLDRNIPIPVANGHASFTFRFCSVYGSRTELHVVENKAP